MAFSIRQRSLPHLEVFPRSSTSLAYCARLIHELHGTLIDAARERNVRAIFGKWDAYDINKIVRLMRKFADAVKEEPEVLSRTEEEA